MLQLQLVYVLCIHAKRDRSIYLCGFAFTKVVYVFGKAVASRRKHINLLQCMRLQFILSFCCIGLEFGPIIDGSELCYVERHAIIALAVAVVEGRRKGFG